MKRIILFLLIGILFLPNGLGAQNFKKRKGSDPRFKIGVIMGLNAAQIDGDNQIGYRKMGIGAGLRGIAVISPNLELSFELLFSQKGSKPSSNTSRIDALTFNLNYAEVPVLLNILGKEGWDEFRPLHFQVGASFSRLLSSSVKEARNRPLKELEVPYKTLEENLNSNEINIVLGATYYFSKHIGFGLRHSYALTQLFNTDDYPEVANNSLRSYHLNAQVTYIF